MGGTSRISREAYVRICERLGVKLPGATRRFGRPPPLCRSNGVIGLNPVLIALRKGLCGMKSRNPHTRKWR
jgi:hypothetical protein